MKHVVFRKIDDRLWELREDGTGSGHSEGQEDNGECPRDILAFHSRFLLSHLTKPRLMLIYG